MTSSSGNDPWPTWPEPVDPQTASGANSDPVPNLKGHAEINKPTDEGWSWLWIITVVVVVVIIFILILWFLMSGGDTGISVLDSLRDPKNSIEPK